MKMIYLMAEAPQLCRSEVSINFYFSTSDYAFDDDTAKKRRLELAERKVPNDRDVVDISGQPSLPPLSLHSDLWIQKMMYPMAEVPQFRRSEVSINFYFSASDYVFDDDTAKKRRLELAKRKVPNDRDVIDISGQSRPPPLSLRSDLWIQKMIYMMAEAPQFRRSEVSITFLLPTTRLTMIQQTKRRPKRRPGRLRNWKRERNRQRICSLDPFLMQSTSWL
jgi:hypothetical protein